jgi:hypothetical protein
MRLPLNSHVVDFLLKQGYEYWLSKREYIPSTDSSSGTTLIPVHKADSINLSHGYAFFKITPEILQLPSVSENNKILVNLNNEDMLAYKEFLIEEVNKNSLHYTH